MRILSTLSVAAGALAVLGSVASSSTIHAIPRGSARPPGLTPRHVPNATRRRETTASCAGGTIGEGSQDSRLLLETGNQTGYWTLGSGDVAAAQYSTAQGSHNTICDYDSSIGGGYENVIDSGSGHTPSGASYSAIGAGTANTIDASYSFIGAGAANDVSGFYGFVGGGSSNSAGGHSAFVGGGSGNSATGLGSFVGGGGLSAGGNVASETDGFIGSGDNNVNSGIEGFIGAGQGQNLTGIEGFAGAGSGNMVTGNQAFVGAGESGTASGTDSAVVGGYKNTASGLGAFVGAGGTGEAESSQNSMPNVAGGADAFIGAGDQNSASGLGSFIGSGDINSTSTNATYASVLGGKRNAVAGPYASILGGFGNTANGEYAIVAGGDANTAAGILSFAAGYHADAAHNGTFVWSDYSSGSTTLSDTAANQFLARASGGFYLYSNEAATAGVKLAAGSGTWASLSDRNAKTDIAPLDDDEVLSKVAMLPVSTWRYKTEHDVRHAGPMAQDFYAAFGVGEDDRHITSIDEDGVALSAIKALNRKLGSVARLQTTVAVQRGEIRSLAAAVAELKREIDRLRK